MFAYNNRIVEFLFNEYLQENECKVGGKAFPKYINFSKQILQPRCYIKREFYQSAILQRPYSMCKTDILEMTLNNYISI